MRESIRILKKQARCSILGFLTTAVGANVLYLSVSWFIPELLSGVVPGNGVLAWLASEAVVWLAAVFTGIFEYGLCEIYLRLQYGQGAKVSDLLRGFQENTDTIIRLQALLCGIQVLCMMPASFLLYLRHRDGLSLAWFLAAFAAGLILYYAIELNFAMSLYLLADFPGLTAMQAVSRSAALMKGHRLLLLCLTLSFLPMMLLSLLSFGIGGLWVMGYRNAARASLYRRLMEQRASARS